MSKVPNSDQLSEESLLGLLRAVFAQAIATATGTPVEPAAAAVRISADPKFGDYQCNAAMALAKTLKGNPRQVAEKIVAAASPLLETIAEPLEIAGPGFINIRLRDAFLAGKHPSGPLGYLTKKIELLEGYGITPEEADRIPKKLLAVHTVYHQVMQMKQEEHNATARIRSSRNNQRW